MMNRKEIRKMRLDLKLYLYTEAGRKVSKAFQLVNADDICANKSKKLIFGPAQDGETERHLEDRLLGTTYWVEVWLIGGIADYFKVLPCGCKIYRDIIKPRTRKIKKPEQRKLTKLYRLHNKRYR